MQDRLRTDSPSAGSHLVKSVNARTLLDATRAAGPISRAELARRTGLSKPTVSTILAELNERGLVRRTGLSTGVAGPAATLYEINRDAAFVMGIDVGREYLRAAIADLHGNDRARVSLRAHADDEQGRLAEILHLVEAVRSQAGLRRESITRTVIGGPGVYDVDRDEALLAGQLTGWANRRTIGALRAECGDDLVIENDVNAATDAERTRGQGRGLASFAFVSIGTGVGMGLVIDGSLRRGVHGIAGELGYLPFAGGRGNRASDAQRRGNFEAAASAAAVVRAARRAGMREVRSAVAVFTAAARGDDRAKAVVSDEASLVARAICAVVVVADPQAIILGGGIGQAEGFAAAVQQHLDSLSPVHTPVYVSALGSQAVLDGCLAQGLSSCWEALSRT